MFNVSKLIALTLVVLVCSPARRSDAQTPAPAHHPKHILVIGAVNGWQHESVTPSMVAVYEMGQESGLWDAALRTDTQLLTKKKIPRNGKDLSYYDAIVFASPTGEMDLDDSQKADLLSFVKQDGKGFVGIHAALDANYKWPEYGEMIGGWFDEHPWMTFDAPIINEAPDFPATQSLPKAFTKYDEIYQPKSWSRDKVNVLLSLDPTKLSYDNNPRVHRTDHDFPVAWTKMYGNGRVFYSTLGHTPESWKDPDVRKMYFEAIKWSLGLTEGSTASHARPAAGK